MGPCHSPSGLKRNLWKAGPGTYGEGHLALTQTMGGALSTNSFALTDRWRRVHQQLFCRSLYRYCALTPLFKVTPAAPLLQLGRCQRQAPPKQPSKEGVDHAAQTSHGSSSCLSSLGKQFSLHTFNLPQPLRSVPIQSVFACTGRREELPAYFLRYPGKEYFKCLTCANNKTNPIPITQC